MDEIHGKIAGGQFTQSEQEELWDAVVLTCTDIEELLCYVRERALHDFIYPMFVFAAHTGARRSEMRRSLCCDVNLRFGFVEIRERKRVRGVCSTRMVPLSPLLTDVMSTWLANHPCSPYTFCIAGNVAKSRKRTPGPRQLTCEEAGHHFRQALRGSRFAKLRGWHVFRHSFCSNCAASGIDQRLINEWVGHQTEDMVRRYRHLFPHQQHAAIGRVFGK
jgi:integrase